MTILFTNSYHLNIHQKMNNRIEILFFLKMSDELSIFLLLYLFEYRNFYILIGKFHWVLQIKIVKN